MYLDDFKVYLILKDMSSGKQPFPHDYDYDHNSFEKVLGELKKKGYLIDNSSVSVEGFEFLQKNNKRFLRDYSIIKSSELKRNSELI